MQILIAPNAFKNSLAAATVAASLEKGFMESRLNCVCECFPVGDGTASLIIKKCGAELISTTVQDPLGRKINIHIGLIDNGQTAIIEMADAAGLRLLQPGELNPLLATSFGTGEQVRIALNHGVKKIIIGMGGSATVDGACGMLQALGIVFLDAGGAALEGLPANLINLNAIDISSLDKRIAATQVVVLCEDANMLLGENGAAAMFGPQKGASAAAVVQLNKALAKFAEVTLQQTGKDMAAIKYGGTAGGAAAGLFAFLDARLVNGIDYFLDLTAFDASLAKADLVITGEGSIDEQTLQGKGPFGVACRAKLKKLPVIGIAGKVPLEKNAALQKYFDVLLPISHQSLDLPTALAATERNLVRTATELGNLLALNQQGVFTE